VLWAGFFSYSYSDVIVGGATGNVVIGDTYTWSMDGVLPNQYGLTVNGVIYRYTVNKSVEDALSVTIRNENKLDEGYVFSSTDDWTGLPGNTINKFVPTIKIPRAFWGPGEMVVEGQGDVSDATIAYNYTYNACFFILANPDCPGYIQALYKWLKENGLLDPELNDPYYDEWVQMNLNRKTDPEEEKKQAAAEEERKRENALRTALLGDAISKLANAAEESAKIEALGMVPNFESYYTSIPGGVYQETLVLQDATLPDNASALRNLAQQDLHEQMIRLQYQ